MEREREVKEGVLALQLFFCIRSDIFGEQLFESMNNKSVATAELTWIRLSMQTSQVQVLYKLPSMPV